jgi:hypothetical protein
MNADASRSEPDGRVAIRAGEVSLSEVEPAALEAVNGGAGVFLASPTPTTAIIAILIGLL